MNRALTELRSFPLRGERDEEELERIQRVLTIFAYGVSLVNDALNTAHGALLDGRRLAGAIHDGGSQYRRMIRTEADQYRGIARGAQQQVYPFWQEADGARTN